MKKHILVVSQYFYPEQFRINDICKEWTKRGYKVTVITGIPNYPQGKYYEGYGLFKKRKEIYEGINIIRIPLIPRGKNKIMLALNYLSFVVSGFFWKILTTIQADYVFIFEVSPMTQALPGVWYAKKKKIPCYIYVQDLWPENVEIIAGITNKKILGGIGKMVDYIYKNSTKIFTTSKSFVKAIQSRGVSLRKLEYWPQYAENFYVPLSKKKLPEINDDFFNVIYTGNIGHAQGLEILIKTGEIIDSNTKNIRFNIVGDGRYKETLIKGIDREGLNHVFNFIPSQKNSKIPEFLAASNVAFLSLSDNPLFNMTIPAKLQSYMACGIPIVAAAEGETDLIIKESYSGLCSETGNAEKLAKNIITLSEKTSEELNEMGNNARKYYERHFDKEKLMMIMDSFLQ